MIPLTALLRLTYGLLIAALVGLAPTQSEIDPGESDPGIAAPCAERVEPARSGQDAFAGARCKNAEPQTTLDPEESALEEEEQEDRAPEAHLLVRTFPGPRPLDFAPHHSSGPVDIWLVPLESSDCTRGPPVSSLTA